MLATQADMDSIDAYCRTIAPFYAAEMRSRDDLADWKALARRLDAKRIRVVTRSRAAPSNATEHVGEADLALRRF